MTLEQGFEFASTLALLGWALLALAVLAPAGRQRTWLLRAGGRAVPLILAVMYGVLLVAYWRSAPGGGFGSLDAVARLFASRGKLLGGWVHFLAFDLLVGRWMVDRVLEEGRTRWLLLPCLPLTLMFGPLGLVLFWGLLWRPTQGRTAGPRG